MASTSLTRRGFLKMAAVTGAACALAGGAGTALAENDAAANADGGITRVRSCCRACGKNECGVYIVVQNGRAIRVEGDADTAFHSMGNSCSKSQASMQAAYHPDRVYYPMKRTNPKGSADPGWVRITWDEAYKTIAQKFQELIDKYGGECLFFMGGTSRIWTQHAYAAWLQLTGSPNAVTAWQICKGPRHMATEMVDEFAWSWMATTDRPRVFVPWGTATEISNYDEAGRTTVDIAKNADCYIDVDPRLTNLGHEADIHQYVTPGTDGALGLAWAHVIVKNELYKPLYVKRWTDSPFLVVDDMEPTAGPATNHKCSWWECPPMMTRLLKESDIKEGGSNHRFMVWDTLAGTDEDHPLHENDATGMLTYFDAETGLWEGQPDVQWDHFYDNPQPNLPEGVVPGRIAEESPFDPEIDPALYGTFEITLADGKTYSAQPVWQKLVDHLEDYAPEKVQDIVGIKAEDIEKAAITYATPIDPSTGYGNGGIQYGLASEHACNAIQNNRIYDMLAGMTGNLDTPAGNRGPSCGSFASVDDAQPTLGSKHGEGVDFSVFYDKIIGCEKIPTLSWWQEWADANCIVNAMLTGDPYPVRGGLCEASGFLNQSNSNTYWEALNSLDFFVIQDLWKTPTAGAADIILPVYHWMEVDCPRLSQGATGAQGATCRAIEPPAECHFDVQIVLDVYKAMGVPWIDYPEEFGWGEDKKNPTVDDLYYLTLGRDWEGYKQEFQEHGWWDCRAINPEGWGTYRRYECGIVNKINGYVPPTPAGNPMPGFPTPTRKQEFWSTVMETFEPDGRFNLPTWDPAPSTELAGDIDTNEYPLLMTTGRRIPVYFHSEHRQLPWCRELWPAPRMEINPVDAEKLGLKQGDWAWIENQSGKIRQTVDLYYGIKPGVINLEHQWWYPELDQADHGFALSSVNCLVNMDEYDPICGSSHLRAYNVKVYKATPENSPFGNPVPCGDDGTEIIHDSSDPRLKLWDCTYDQNVRDAK